MSVHPAAHLRGFRGRLLGARSAAAGAVFYAAMTWFDRALGVISTVILARLLVPEDFGIVALASIVLGFLSVMFDVGLNVRLVQMDEVDQADIDTAWTLQILRAAFLAVLLFTAAPSIGSYFSDPRLTPVMYWMAFGILISGAGNMAPALFQKRREFAREVSYFMAKRFFSFAVTLVLAFLMRDYWAMVFGSVAATAFGVALSYWMMPGLRMPTLRNWRRFLGAGMWLTLRSIGQYASSQLDKVFVGRIGGSAMLGAYSIADQIAAMPSSELLAPIGRALFPVFAQAKNDPARLGRAVHLSFGVQSLIALPASVGLALCSHELVRAMLGEKWADAAPLLGILAISYGFSSLNTGFYYVLLALGKFRQQAALYWINALLLLAVLYAAVGTFDAYWVASLRVAFALLFSIGLIVVTLYAAPAISLKACLEHSWRQFFATVSMSAAVAWVGVTAASWDVWILLAAKVAVGVVVYVGLVLALWRMVGCPDSAERWILAFLRKLIVPSASRSSSS